MATPQVSGGNGVSVIADLANLLGGQKTSTTGNANTSLIGQLAPQLMNPADPAAIISQLFSAAQGQLPALQAARANAVGARSGRNSSVVNATDKLQQDTILKAQAQIAQQEMQRQQTAAQLAASLAQATRGTTTQQGTNLGRAAGMLGLLQAGSKFADSSLGKRAGTMFDQGAEQLQTMLSPSTGGEMYPGQASMESGQSFSPDAAVFDFSNADWNGGSGGSAADYGSAAGSVDYGSFVADEGMADYADEFADFIGLADGGLIGRDDVAQRKIMAQYKPKGYADGGQVTARSAGGRRSSAPTYAPDVVQRASAMRPMSVGMGGASSSDAADSSIGVADSTDTVDGSNANLGQVAAIAASIAMGNPIGAIAAAIGNPAVSAMMNTPAAIASQNPIAIAQAMMNAINAASSGTTSTPSPEADTIMGVSPVDVDAMDAVNAAMTNDAATSSDSGPGAAGGGAPGTGDSATGGNGGDAAGDGTAGAADGGHVSGKGTGISDSIGIRVSKGEYIVPADVVAKMGTDFFDNLRAQFHVPAAMQALDTDDEDGDDIG